MENGRLTSAVINSREVTMSKVPYTFHMEHILFIWRGKHEKNLGLILFYRIGIYVTHDKLSNQTSLSANSKYDNNSSI